MKRLLILSVWLPTTLATLLVTLALQNYRYQFLIGQRLQEFSQTVSAWHPSSTYQLYSSLPKVLGASTASITAQDAIPELVNQYLADHDSPMTPYADDLVGAARKNGLDPLLLVAIAQCESNLGKKMPDGCNNPFGWGIHSKGTLCFDSWQEGFDTVAKGLRDKYFADGLQSPEELMVRYTPPALENDGSWAKCVNYFLDSFETPEETTN
jgi:hypothetical protein